ncbi:putative Fe-S cluster-containing radical SAM superfamily protein [Janthinobacterium sp. CG_23.3]
MFMLVSIASGVITHKRIFKRLSTFRRAQFGLAQAYTEGCKLRPGNLCWLLTRPSMSAGATARLR